MDKYRWVIVGGFVEINGKRSETKLPDGVGIDTDTGELVVIPPDQVTLNKKALAHIEGDQDVEK